MSTPKYHKIVNLPATLLKRSDLNDLERAVCDGFQDSRTNLQITVGDTQFDAGSIAEMLSRDGLPSVTERLSLSSFDRSGDKFAILTLHKNFATFQVASDEENWFYGKLERVRRLFSRHRPWYWWLTGLIAGVTANVLLFGSLIGGALLVWAALTDTRFYWGLIAPALTLLASFVVFFNVFSNLKVFPFVRIELAERTAKISFETLSLIISGLTLIATVTSIVVTAVIALT